MLKSLATSTVPHETTEADALFVCTVTGKNVDGTDFSSTVSSASLPASMDLPAGTGFVLVIAKTIGNVTFTSGASDPVDIAAPVTITVQVPDGNSKASIG